MGLALGYKGVFLEKKLGLHGGRVDVGRLGRVFLEKKLGSLSWGSLICASNKDEIKSENRKASQPNPREKTTWLHRFRS